MLVSASGNVLLGCWVSLHVRERASMTEGRCKRCDQWTSKPWDCRCQKFEIFMPYKADQEIDWEDASEVWATDAEEAVEQYCDKYDCEGDYTIIHAGGCDLIYCRGEDPEGNTEITKWKVTAETEINYYAYQRE